MIIEKIKVSDLIPYANNARTHSDEQVAQIASSIREFGFANPVLIDAQNGIIAGHGRVLASRKLGLDEVPCIRLPHLSEAQKKAFILADNRLALNAGWDEELLRIEISSLGDAGFNLDVLGFTEDELANFLAKLNEEGKTDPDDVPETPVQSVTVAGDIWILENHRVMCGDSTSATEIEKLLDGKKANLWITDPPYNVNYEGGTGLTIMNDSMEDNTFREFLRNSCASADANMEEGAVFYIWHADSEGFNFRGACHDIGWKVRQCLIWVKSSLVMGRQDYHWKHEPCLYGWKEGAGHFWGNDRKQTTTLEFDKPKRNGEHPTMKPVELFAYQIKNISNGGAIVLDSFGGSGTTIIACEQLGRNGYAMELDPKYVDVIVERWQNFTGKKAINLSTNKIYDETKNAMHGNTNPT